MRLVVLESPYRGDIGANEDYAFRAALDCLRRGESPIASHLFFPRFLNDRDPGERELGMRAGHAWMDVAEAVVVYQDRGITDGMKLGIANAKAVGCPVEYRSLNRDFLP